MLKLEILNNVKQIENSQKTFKVSTLEEIPGSL